MHNVAVLAALGFASYRATQLAVWDSILDPLRGTPDSALERWHANGISPDRSNRGRDFVLKLFQCVYCIGFHMSWLAVLAYWLAVGDNPVASWGSFLLFGIESFAVAGAQALLNRYDDTMDGK